MKVIGNRVIVEVTQTEKVGKLFIPEKAKENNKNYALSYKIAQIGKDCPKDVIKEGDIPIFSQYAAPLSVKVLEVNKLFHSIYNFEDIIGIDNE
ncbi:MAG: hypothetical protein ACRC0V_08495 [Fusobacteriaceae bacterium]